MYEERQYRGLFNGNGLEYFEVVNFETDLKIGAKNNLYAEANKVVSFYRNQISNYIIDHQEFLKTFKPIDCDKDAPLIVKKMYEAAKLANVGPMATIAGAISEMVGIKLLQHSDEVIIENGGDIFIYSESKRVVGIYAGTSILSNKIGIEIMPKKRLGICTSSGTVGHSTSFGVADAAIVISENTFLADACATAFGNMLKNENSIELALNTILSVNGVIGAIGIIEDKIGVKGDIKLVYL